MSVGTMPVRRGVWALLALLAFAAPASAKPPLNLLAGEDGVPTFAPLLENVTPAVVNIAVITRFGERGDDMATLLHRFYGLPEMKRRDKPRISAGSGVIVDAGRGYVLTNHHVIDDAEKVLVTLKDRRSFEAKVVGGDPDTDIALLKIPAEKLVALPMGDSDKLNVGDIVVAIGNPFGLGQTVTSGIVSALGRSGITPEGYEDFIQTDASINPGNSGGALVNLKGELVGVNAAIINPATGAGGNVGIGFAVPTRMARAVMDQLIRYGRVRRGMLGVTIKDLTPDEARKLGAPDARVVIREVSRGSAAEKAGLRPGDAIMAVNGKPLRGVRDLRSRVGVVAIGTELNLDIVRNGRPMSVRSMVGDNVPAPAALETSASVRHMVGAVVRESPHPGLPGVYVAKVEPDSPAWRIGLREGDVIVAVNSNRVASVNVLKDALAETRAGLSMHVARQGSMFFLNVR